MQSFYSQVYQTHTAELYIHHSHKSPCDGNHTLKMSQVPHL